MRIRFFTCFFVCMLYIFYSLLEGGFPHCGPLCNARKGFGFLMVETELVTVSMKACSVCICTPLKESGIIMWSLCSSAAVCRDTSMDMGMHSLQASYPLTQSCSLFPPPPPHLQSAPSHSSIDPDMCRHLLFPCPCMYSMHGCGFNGVFAISFFLAVEQNLVGDELSILAHWQLFNELFPLSMACDNLTQNECLLYR